MSTLPLQNLGKYLGGGGVILRCGVILIIGDFQILEFEEINVGKSTNYCLKFILAFPVIWIPINISLVMM